MPDNCIICREWPERRRRALREMLDTFPLQEEPVCNECLMVFWRNMGLPARDGDATEH
jgi:hypothetical protein